MLSLLLVGVSTCKRGFPSDISNCRTLEYRNYAFHCKGFLGAEHGYDLGVAHPCGILHLRILHLCLSCGLSQDCDILTNDIGFAKDHSKCRVLQIRVQVCHRHDTAAVAMPLAGNNPTKVRKKNTQYTPSKVLRQTLIRNARLQTQNHDYWTHPACSRKILGTRGRRSLSKFAINAGLACATSN